VNPALERALEACASERIHLSAAIQPHGYPEPDHAAPVVDGQRDRAVDAQTVQKGLQILDPRRQRVVVTRRRALRVVRLVRQSHADVIGHDAAIAVAQAQDEVPPVVAPRGIPVQHHHDLAVARALVEVVHLHPGAYVQTVVSEGIVRKLHGH